MGQCFPNPRPRRAPPKRIPITVAKDVANKCDMRQIILLGWDGDKTHIATYGKSRDDCAQAAAGGNMLKAKWGWPECNDQPSRVKKLEQRVRDLESFIAVECCREIPDGLS